MIQRTFRIRFVVLMAIATLAVAERTTAQGVLAYRDATIETVGKAGRIEKGTLLIRDGKIEAVGDRVDIPETAKVIDATGKTLMPGIVDPYYVISLATPGGMTTRTIVIDGRTFTITSRPPVTSTVFTRIADSFDPMQTRWWPAVRSGITTANLVSRGYGQSARARMTPDDSASILQEPNGHLFLAVTNRTSSLNVLRSGLSGGTPSRGGARGRPTGRGASGISRSAPGARGAPSTRSGATRTPSPTRPLWQHVRQGKRPVIINVDNAAAILHLKKALAFHKDVQVLLVSTGENLYRTLEHLKGSKISVVLRPGVDLVPDSEIRVNMARLMQDAKLTFAFSLTVTGSSFHESQDAPLFPVAMLVKTGLERQAAFKALTLTPAKLLGIDKQVGSLEAGKTANLVVCDGDPFSVTTRIRQVLVDGRPVYEG